MQDHINIKVFVYSVLSNYKGELLIEDSLGLQTSQMEDPFVHMSLEVSPTSPDYLLNLICRHVAYHYLMPSQENIPHVSCFQSIIDTGYDFGLST